jgi:RIO kinase 1
MKERRSEEFEALEEVFDKPTLMTIYGMINKGVIKELHGVVNSGKESRIYLGRAPDGTDLAVKIYLTGTSDFSKGMLQYILGDPRFTHVKQDRRSLIRLWASKEFRNLEEAYRAGVRVPKPVHVKDNVLVMEFIGSGGVSAPLLREVRLKSPRRFFDQLLDDLRKLCRKANLVHADLSEYNIMVYDDKPVIFDMSQSVSLEHPMSKKFLERDLQNLRWYFRRYRVKIPKTDQLLESVTSGAS